MIRQALAFLLEILQQPGSIMEASQGSDVSSLEKLEQLKLEKLKTVLGFVQFLVGTVALGILTAVINWQIQYKQLEMDRQKREQEYLSQFVNQALDDNLEKRIRFAEYFATLTLTPDLDRQWGIYLEILNSKAAQQESELEQIAEALSDMEGNIDTPEELDEYNKLVRRFEQLSANLAITPGVNQVLYQWDTNKLDTPIVEGLNITWRQALRNGETLPRNQQDEQNIIDLANQLLRLQNQIGKPIILAGSLYRPEPFNSQEGGASASQHLIGKAADIRVEGLTARELATTVRPLWNGGVGIPAESGGPTAIHIDIGPKRSWGL